MDHPYNFYISLCHLQLNNLDSSEYYLQGCIKEAETQRGESWVHFNHLYYMGIVCFEKENYQQASRYFDRALKQYPQFSDAEFYKAMCCYETGQKQAALVLLEKAYKDHNEGYSLNEDNARYEYYPYQVREYGFTSALQRMRAELGKK
jgi:tetratricopeptide (TPR) repeat protein